MKAIVPALVTNLVFLALLLGCAGRVDYVPAWAYFATSLAMAVATRLVLRNNPDLADERAQVRSDAQAWDKKLLGLGFLLTIGMLVAAGLDAGRFRATSALGWPGFAVGLALNVIGSGLFLRSLAENRFFSSVVRIQADRGHTVCRTGPYAVVRHPGYAGMIVGTAGLPLLLMSTWSGLFALLFVVVLVVRTAREDAFLTAELGGYRAYREDVRHRLVPGVW
jgi:protein-S-isoprenylcysteine O-methyltransferase Ste14